jgi:tripartite-type tricarboxylate transporter receptor subunit TctC
VKLPRRQFLHLTAGATALPALSRIARAQSYPSRPVRWIVGYPPGGAGDVVARLIGQWLSERLGQPLIIDNKPGAGSNISVQAALNASPDGYTLLYVATVQAINTSLYEALPFNFLHDFSPVASIAQIPLVMVVSPSVPATTVASFAAYAKANPGKINMASFGTGSSSHLAGEMFKAMASVDMTHVPYRGSAPALTDLIGGRVEVMFDTILASLPHIKSGSLRALAVTGKARSELMPNVPTIGDTITGYEAEAWNGIVVRQGTPPEIIERLSRETNAALADATIRARLIELGTVPHPRGPSDFGAFMVAETAKWAKVVKASGAKAD